MQFEIHQINGGQCHWCPVGEQGAKLAVSARALRLRAGRAARRSRRAVARRIDRRAEER
jgi:ribosomal protein L28